MNSSNEFSLNTPMSENILNNKIINIFYKKNIKGGDNTNTSPIITIIIGIIIFAIGYYLYENTNIFTSQIAQVISVECDDLNKKCKINIKYSVNMKEYTKTVIVNKNDVPIELEELINNTTKSNSDINSNINANTNAHTHINAITHSNDNPKQIQIYYQESNPNIIRLYDFNYKIIGTILMTTGIFITIIGIIN